MLKHICETLRCQRIRFLWGTLLQTVVCTSAHKWNACWGNEGQDYLTWTCCSSLARSMPHRLVCVRVYNSLLRQGRWETQRIRSSLAKSELKIKLWRRRRRHTLLSSAASIKAVKKAEKRLGPHTLASRLSNREASHQTLWDVHSLSNHSPKSGSSLLLKW